MARKRGVWSKSPTTVEHPQFELYKNYDIAGGTVVLTVIPDELVDLKDLHRMSKYQYTFRKKAGDSGLSGLMGHESNGLTLEEAMSVLLRKHRLYRADTEENLAAFEPHTFDYAPGEGWLLPDQDEHDWHGVKPPTRCDGLYYYTGHSHKGERLPSRDGFLTSAMSICVVTADPAMIYIRSGHLSKRMNLKDLPAGWTNAPLPESVREPVKADLLFWRVEPIHRKTMQGFYRVPGFPFPIRASFISNGERFS